MLSLIKIKDIHQYEDTDYVSVIFRTGPRATHMVRAGDLVPGGTTLVTPDVEWPQRLGKRKPSAWQNILYACWMSGKFHLCKIFADLHK